MSISNGNSIFHTFFYKLGRYLQMRVGGISGVS